LKKKKNIFEIHADWKAVLLCIFAASTFWFFNAMNNEYTANISYPVKIVYDENKLVPLAKLPSRIRFNASGYGWDFLRKNFMFRVKPLHMEVSNLPAKNYITSSELYPVVSEQIKNIQVNYVLPDTFFLNFDHLVKKKIALKVNMDKIPVAPDYRVDGAVILNPDSIIVTGPRFLIDTLSDTMAVEIPGKNIKGSFEESVNLEYKINPLVKLNQSEVKVHFTAALFQQQSKLIEPLKINFPLDTNELILSDKKLILTYFLKSEDANKVSKDDFEVILNYKKLKREDSTIVPELVNFPSFIKEYYFTPAAVKIGHE
jgi:hypothetical protein